MASSSGAGDEQDVFRWVREIKRQIDSIDQKVRDFRAGLTLDEIRPATEEATAVEIEELYADQEAFKKTFRQLTRTFFFLSGEGEDEDIALRDPFANLPALKRRLQRMREEEDLLEFKFRTIFAGIRRTRLNVDSTGSIETNTTDSTTVPESFELFSLSRFVRSGYISLYFQNYEAYQEWSPRLLSKKLGIVQFYCLERKIEPEQDDGEEDRPAAINARLQRRFGWLRSGKDPEGDSELKAEDVEDMKLQIMRMARERRREKGEARARGKRSLMEFMILDRDGGQFTTLNLIHRKTREICESLSLHLGHMFYVVAESGLANYKFRHHLRDVLMWLKEKGRTPVIRRFVAVLRKAAAELYARDKGEVEPPLAEITAAASSWRQEPMDRVLDGFLREILRVESVMSYPNLSEEFMSTTSVELKTFQRALEDSGKAVAQMRGEMEYLRVIYRYVAENVVEETEAMASFDVWLAEMVAGVWEKLFEGYNPT